MQTRHLGRSGLKISEIAYGNWITHGSQVEEDVARACVAAALSLLFNLGCPAWPRLLILSGVPP